MTHLEQIKSNVETKVAELYSYANSADISLYFDLTSQTAQSLVQRLKKAEELCTPQGATGVKLLLTDVIKYILINTDDVVAELNLLDTCGVYGIRNASHLKYVASSLCTRADELWIKQSFKNYLQHRFMGKSLYLSQLNNLLTPAIVMQYAEDEKAA